MTRKGGLADALTDGQACRQVEMGSDFPGGTITA